MLITATTFTFKLFVSTFQGIRAVVQVLGYVLSSSIMSSTKIKVNYNTKHLAKGDPLPSFNGKLRLYNMRYCPFAQRAVLALIAKNIDFEVINVDLVSKPEWMASKSALTKVPALEISDGISIYESLVIVEYLDDAYPQRPLLPKDPLKKAVGKVLVEAGTPLIQALLFKLIRSPESITEDVIASYHQGLSLLENHLQQQGTKFLDGAEPGYADYMIWPWFERLDIINDKKAEIDETKFKLLKEYIKNMWEDPVVIEYAVPKDIMQSFFEAYRANKKPDYDRLLQE